MSNGLTEGWVRIRLGEAVMGNVQSGFACGTHNRTATGVAHLRPMNVNESGKIDLSILKFVPASEVDRSERWVTTGDVLFNNTNSPELVGKTAYYGESEPRAFSNHMTRVRCQPNLLDARFCATALHQLWRAGYFESICNNHVSQASISRSVLLETEIALPPLAEQVRIVEKVEALLEQVNHARARLDRVPAILKRFRQSVLAAACSGELTEDWREESGMPKDVDQAWTHGSVASVSDAVVDCSHSTPKWTAQGEICLRTTNFSTRGLDLSEVRYVSRQTYDDRTNRLVPRAGDVVYSREGGILGIACVLPEGLRACLGQRMMLMRCKPSVIRPEFMSYVLNGPHTLAVVRELTGGTASPHLNVGDIKRFDVPLPSYAEQDEVLGRGKALFSLADTIERRVAATSSCLANLTQSILSKAFAGELVPTAAELARTEGRTFETAAELLASIQAQNRTPHEKVTSAPRRPPPRAGAG